MVPGSLPASTWAVVTVSALFIDPKSCIKALYRGYAIECAGQACYGPKQRHTWLAPVTPQFDARAGQDVLPAVRHVRKLRQGVRQQLLAEGKKHKAYRPLQGIPQMGPVGTVLLIAFLQIAERFRGKRQIWAYCGFALETHSSGDHRWVKGQRERSKKAAQIRGLNSNHHHVLKWIFKSAATRACARPGLFEQPDSDCALTAASC